MSKGLGRIERLVIELLAGRETIWMRRTWSRPVSYTADTLLTKVIVLAGHRVLEPSLRRAIASLKRKGLIALDPAMGSRPPLYWMLAPAAKKLAQSYERDNKRRREWAEQQEEQEREEALATEREWKGEGRKRLI